MASRYCERSSNSAHSSLEVHSRILQFNCVTSSSKRSLPSWAVNLSLYSTLPRLGSGGKENGGAPVGKLTSETWCIWWAGTLDELVRVGTMENIAGTPETRQVTRWRVGSIKIIPIRQVKQTLRLPCLCFKSILLMVCKGKCSNIR